MVLTLMNLDGVRGSRGWHEVGDDDKVMKMERSNKRLGANLDAMACILQC